MKSPIVGFHLGDDQHWVADLACGHTRHVRHEPPWTLRPWVLTEEGRAKFIGVEMECAKCDAESPNSVSEL